MINTGIPDTNNTNRLILVYFHIHMHAHINYKGRTVFHTHLIRTKNSEQKCCSYKTTLGLYLIKVLPIDVSPVDTYTESVLSSTIT